MQSDRELNVGKWKLGWVVIFNARNSVCSVHSIPPSSAVCSASYCVMCDVLGCFSVVAKSHHILFIVMEGIFLGEPERVSGKDGVFNSA